MKYLISWCHDDCTYSLLKVLSLLPDTEIYIPSKPLDGFITFLLDYNRWPIRDFKKIIRPLESISLDEIDVYIAEIVSVKHFSDGYFSDLQVEWGTNNIGLDRMMVYSYNVVSMDKFKYRDRLPLISSSKISYLTYGSAPKHFFYAEPPILNYSRAKFDNRLILIQNSYEIQKKSIPIYMSLINNSVFLNNFDIRYYGFTEDEFLKKINYCNGERIDREVINKIIKDEMTFSLHLKDHEGYGYNPLKCMFAGRPVINYRPHVNGMTYEDYLIDGVTGILFYSLDELYERLQFYKKNRKALDNFSLKTSRFVKRFFNFDDENVRTSEFIRLCFQQ